MKKLGQPWLASEKVAAARTSVGRDGAKKGPEDSTKLQLVVDEISPY